MRPLSRRPTSLQRRDVMSRLNLEEINISLTPPVSLPPARIYARKPPRKTPASWAPTSSVKPGPKAGPDRDEIQDFQDTTTVSMVRRERKQLCGGQCLVMVRGQGSEWAD